MARAHDSARSEQLRSRRQHRARAGGHLFVRAVRAQRRARERPISEAASFGRRARRHRLDRRSARHRNPRRNAGRTHVSQPRADRPVRRRARCRRTRDRRDGGRARAIACRSRSSRAKDRRSSSRTTKRCAPRRCRPRARPASTTQRADRLSESLQLQSIHCRAPEKRRSPSRSCCSASPRVADKLAHGVNVISLRPSCPCQFCPQQATEPPVRIAHE